jgi:hypothetical protein
MEDQESTILVYYEEFKLIDKILNFSDGIYVVIKKPIYKSPYSSYGVQITGKVLTKNHKNKKDFENSVKIVEKLAADFAQEYCDWLEKKRSAEKNVVNKISNKKWGKTSPEPKRGGLSAEFYLESFGYY